MEYAVTAGFLLAVVAGSFAAVIFGSYEQNYSVTHDFCRDLSVCPRGHSVLREYTRARLRRWFGCHACCASRKFCRFGCVAGCFGSAASSTVRSVRPSIRSGPPRTAWGFWSLDNDIKTLVAPAGRDDRSIFVLIGVYSRRSATQTIRPCAPLSNHPPRGGASFSSSGSGSSTPRERTSWSPISPPCCRGPPSFSDSRSTSYLRSHPSLGIICA